MFIYFQFSNSCESLICVKVGTTEGPISDIKALSLYLSHERGFGWQWGEKWSTSSTKHAGNITTTLKVPSQFNLHTLPFNESELNSFKILKMFYIEY